jgi:hypothetical protein
MNKYDLFFGTVHARVCPVLICLIWLGAFWAPATERYVTPPGGYGTNNPPYTNWADAATNIQLAVNVAVGGDIIWVTNGIYTNTAMISVLTNITIKSVNGSASTIINGNYPVITNTCVYLYNSNAIIDGFTITNGYSTGNAGGVYMNSGKVLNCYICGNIATDYGGGIWATRISSDKICIISNCVIAEIIVLVVGPESISNMDIIWPRTV